MKRHQVYIGFAVLFVFFTATQTQARIQPNPNSGQDKGSKGIVFVNQSQLSQIAKNFGVKVHTFKISKHDLVKLASSGPKGCGCALEEEAGGGWTCFKDCVRSWNPNLVIGICAGACIGVGTGNIVAIAVCAACLGIEEWIVIGCATDCAFYSTRNVAPKTPLPPNLRGGQKRDGSSARLTLNPIRSGLR
jgi:hypothetical protein